MIESELQILVKCVDTIMTKASLKQGKEAGLQFEKSKTIKALIKGTGATYVC